MKNYIKIGDAPDNWSSETDVADLAPVHPDENWFAEHKKVYREISRQCKGVRQPGYLNSWFGHSNDLK